MASCHSQKDGMRAEALPLRPEVASSSSLCYTLLQVTPIIGIIDSAATSEFRSNEAEVETIFDVPLEIFLKETRHHNHRDVHWNDDIPYRHVRQPVILVLMWGSIRKRKTHSCRV